MLKSQMIMTCLSEKSIRDLDAANKNSKYLHLVLLQGT